ncbi:helix-turn-helix transcriptional regulator [Methylobacterium oryzihabitans]|uniref:HTH luxR-type domain-containing protein n=1 Tax=Methylobacterium oryzihabitans TaxID=2499852 RepID=A0A437P2U8_9HYPH|nr:hypothetical protein [Methylobacterium oryzihabitans]RVU16570.1 hypothetical protein EOE48_15930 [Methylobacterium oryzihabitans]
MAEIGLDDYLGVVDAIYEAAFDPGGWDRVCARFSQLAGPGASGGAGRTGERPIPRSQPDPHWIERLYGDLVRVAPFPDSGPSLRAGFADAHSTILPAEGQARSDVLGDRAVPAGLRDSLLAALDGSRPGPDRHAAMRCAPGADVADDGLALLRRLMPHMIRALRLGQEVWLGRQRQQLLETCLGALSSAVLVLNEGRQVIFLNPAAEALVRHGDALTIQGGTLLARESGSDACLQRALAAAVAAAGEGGTATDVAIARPTGMAVAATVLPLARGRRPASPVHGAALVLIGSPEAQCRNGVAVVAGTHHLTPTESRLLSALVVGDGLGAAAEELAIAPTTARTHLQRIFLKTGTERQGELIRLVTTLAAPTQRGVG